MNLIDLSTLKTATHVIDIVPHEIKDLIKKAAKTQRPILVFKDTIASQYAIVRNGELYLIDQNNIFERLV